MTETTTKDFRAFATRSGRWWAVSVQGMRGVHTQGRNWAEAQEMAQDAIATVLDCPPDEISVELIPALEGVPEALEKLEEATLQLVGARFQHDVALTLAARCIRRAGVSVRDTGAILGIPYQRVSQLTGGSE